MYVWIPRIQVQNNFKILILIVYLQFNNDFILRLFGNFIKRIINNHAKTDRWSNFNIHYNIINNRYIKSNKNNLYLVGFRKTTENIPALFFLINLFIITGSSC